MNKLKLRLALEDIEQRDRKNPMLALDYWGVNDHQNYIDRVTDALDSIGYWRSHCMFGSESQIKMSLQDEGAKLGIMSVADSAYALYYKNDKNEINPDDSKIIVLFRACRSGLKSGNYRIWSKKFGDEEFVDLDCINIRYLGDLALESKVIEKVRISA